MRHVVPFQGRRAQSARYRAVRGHGVCLLVVLAACGRVELGSQRVGTAGASGAAAGSEAAGAAGIGSAGVGGAGVSPEAGSGLDVDAGDAARPGNEPPSCRAASLSCGANDSCCLAPPVAGGDVALPFDAAAEVRVSASVTSFRLDKYEVDVARFREFIADYDAWRSLGNPQPGAGAHPRASGSGWRSEFDASLPALGAELELRVRECDGAPLSTFAASDGAGQLPLNCVSWFEAAAFCAWDEARLPSYAEWYYAAAGGAEDRLYPWGDTPAPNDTLASFGCAEDPEADCTLADLNTVGSHPGGAGPYGHHDLAGSMTEWLLDGSLAALSEGCTDCIAVSDAPERFWRGGSWLDTADNQTNHYFLSLPPALRTPFLGLRCARDGD